MGVGQIIVGVGFCLTALLRFFSKRTLSWVVLIAALLVGLTFIVRAQKKNGSFFS